MTLRVALFALMFICCTITPVQAAEAADEAQQAPQEEAIPSLEEMKAARPEGVAAGQHYLENVGIEESFGQIYDAIAQQIPGDQSKVIISSMKKNVRMDAIKLAVLHSLLNHYNDEELVALADFYSSDVGKSISAKLPAYLEDVNVAIQGEAQRALLMAMREAQLEAAQREAEKAASPAPEQAEETDKAEAPEAEGKDEKAPEGEEDNKTWGKKPAKQE